MPSQNDVGEGASNVGELCRSCVEDPTVAEAVASKLSSKNFDMRSIRLLSKRKLEDILGESMLGPAISIGDKLSLKSV